MLRQCLSKDMSSKCLPSFQASFKNKVHTFNIHYKAGYLIKPSMLEYMAHTINVHYKAVYLIKPYDARVAHAVFCC